MCNIKIIIASPYFYIDTVSLYMGLQSDLPRLQNALQGDNKKDEQLHALYRQLLHHNCLVSKCMSLLTGNWQH